MSVINDRNTDNVAFSIRNIPEPDFLERLHLVVQLPGCPLYVPR